MQSRRGACVFCHWLQQNSLSSTLFFCWVLCKMSCCISISILCLHTAATTLSDSPGCRLCDAQVHKNVPHKLHARCGCETGSSIFFEMRQHACRDVTKCFDLCPILHDAAPIQVICAKHTQVHLIYRNICVDFSSSCIMSSGWMPLVRLVLLAH